MKRIDQQIARTSGSGQFSGGGTLYVVETPSGVLYVVGFMTFTAGGTTGVGYKKSSDGGLTWGEAVNIYNGSPTAVAVWYDRWSGIAAGLIHVAYTQGGTDDTLYRTINTESSDALSTQTVAFAGSSTAGGGMLTITRARGGNVYIRTCIDAGAEGVFTRLINADVPNGAWAARTINEALASTDQMILVPGFAADDQDIMGIFWDASANEISRQIYDDSADTWAETSISTGMTDLIATAAFPNFAVAIDLVNSQIVLVAWNITDSANQDLLGWTVTESAITAFTTTPVLNATDDCGLCGIGINTTTGHWVVVYAGKSDGSETFLTSVNIYCKTSTDSGATWGAETRLTNAPLNIQWLVMTPRFSNNFVVAYHNDVSLDDLMVNVGYPVSPRATFKLGV